MKYVLLALLLNSLQLQGVVYEKPTEQFNPRVEVATLYIEDEDKILLLHRQNNKSEGNKWGIPGGKVEKGETPLQAVAREVYEETGFDFPLESIEHVSTVYVEYNPINHFVYHMFRTQMIFDPALIKINFKEHKGFTWVTPKEGLLFDLIEDEDACFKLVFNL